jgi:cytochrome b
MTDRHGRAATRSPASAQEPASVLVWTLPIRVTHWLLASATIVAWFSANIFDTVHEIAGYSVLALVAIRVALGFGGSQFARFRSFPLRPRAVVKYLGSIVRAKPRPYLGHNPAGAAMALTLLGLLVVSGASGWMQITNRFFGVAWVQDLHTWSSDVVFWLAVVHALAVLLMSYLLRQNLTLGMITGRKQPANAPPKSRRGPASH